MLKVMFGPYRLHAISGFQRPNPRRKYQQLIALKVPPSGSCRAVMSTGRRSNCAEPKQPHVIHRNKGRKLFKLSRGGKTCTGSLFQCRILSFEQWRQHTSDYASVVFILGRDADTGGLAQEVHDA